MIKFLLSLLSLLACVLPASAQNTGCVTPPPQGNIRTTTDPQATLRRQQLSQTQTGPLTLPVVFHVFHSMYGPEPYGYGSNVPHQRLVDMLNTTNLLLRKQNADTALIPAPFQPLAVDCGIELCLAQVDPAGNAMYETGVDRFDAIASGIPTIGFQQPGLFSSTYAGPYAWDPTRYFNVWIMPQYFYNGQFAGYAMFPDSSGLAGMAVANNNGPGDGIYITYTEVSAQAHLMAHEVGHFLGLIHTWGDTNCGDDYCADTPTAAAANYGCPTFPHVTCNNGPDGDMFTNYMDYSQPSCTHQFTPDQRTRMLTTLANSPRRRELPNSTVCTPAAPHPPVAFFTVAAPTSCVGTTNFFVDYSGYQPTSWNWSFPGGTPSTSTALNPQVTYAAPGTYPVTLIVSNAYGSDTLVINNAITILGYGNYPSTEDFENLTQLPPNNWQLLINPNSSPLPNWQLAPASAYGVGQQSMKIQLWIFHPVRSYQLDFTNAVHPVLHFDYAAAYDPQYANDQNDTLAVQVSTDCNTSIAGVFSLGNAAFNTGTPAVNYVPAPGDWRHAMADLSAYAGLPSVHVQLYGYCVPEWLYLDNINIEEWGPLGMPPTGISKGLQVFPNPSADGNVIVSAQTNGVLELLDVTGRSFGSVKVAANKKESVETLFGKHLPAGMYLLRLDEEAGAQQTLRFVVAGGF